MKLLNCYIENFGKLSNFKLDFSEGLNTVKEENGYGKTTLTVFIKAMFFGLDATKRQKLEYNDRKHYTPWQGGRCGGSLSFFANGKAYRIERTFMPKAAEDTFALYDSKTGNLSTDFSENIGEELFQIDADGFERTIFLSEANLSGKNENKTISAKLSDLVGCDGDLSVMDDAIELLERQRKVYYKRGGAGEIGELKEKLGELERNILDILRLEEGYKLQKENLADMTARLGALREAKKKSDEQKLHRTYLTQYLEMKSALNKEIAEKESHAAYFSNGIPTTEEIERARESYARAKQIESEKSDYVPTESSPRSDFSKLKIDEAEYDKARLALSHLSRKNSEKELLLQEISTVTTEDMPEVSTADVDIHISRVQNVKISKKAKNSWHITSIAAFAFLILGIILGLTVTPAAYATCALFVILFPIALLQRKARNAARADRMILDDARALLTKIYATPFEDAEISTLLYNVRTMLAGIEQKRQQSDALKARLIEVSDEISKTEREACEFIAFFKPTGCDSVPSALEHILKEKEIYDVISKSNAAAEARKAKELALSAEYKKAATDFLLRFPCSSDRPFDEISTKLAEYHALCRSVLRMEKTITEFANSHGIDTEAVSFSSEEQIDTYSLATEIEELERTVAITERQCAVMRETIDTKDELSSEKEDLLERISEYERRLSVIQKTKAYLGEAKDILTSKYLSKTKNAFDKYIKLIGNESGNAFNMNTSFSIMREEHGAFKESEAYSRGTRDLYALATRLALIDSLYENESPFIILDDPFAYFDDAKLSAATKALKAIAKEKQILYLTCTKARTI